VPDYLIIILTLIAALAISGIVWVVKDMDREDRELQDTEHWLEHGEKGDTSHGN